MALVPVFILITCASLIDAMHSAALGTAQAKIFLYLEDGGEMVAIAMLATVAAFLARNAADVFAGRNERNERIVRR